jgi:hypothetical protein
MRPRYGVATVMVEGLRDRGKQAGSSADCSGATVPFSVLLCREDSES